MRQGRLNKLCNSKGDVMLVLNQYYAGLFKQFIKLFREKGVAEEYAGVVGKEIADKFIADPEGKTFSFFIFKNISFLQLSSFEWQCFRLYKNTSQLILSD